MNDWHYLFTGVNDIFQGIVAPVIISFAASIVRGCLFGWHGFRHFFANLCVGIFGGVLAHWILARYDLDPTMNAVIVACAALISRDMLQTLFSRQTLEIIASAIKGRIAHEIMSRGAANPASHAKNNAQNFEQGADERASRND